MLIPGIPGPYDGLERSAEISPCGKYRWWLRRTWRAGGDGRIACFVMLNPSTADGATDDNTVKKCMRYIRAWGMSGLVIRNLFPYRATDPRELKTAIEPCGGERGDAELAAAIGADLIICGWGAGVPFGRDRRAKELLVGTELHCLGLTKEGHPGHPLFLPSNLVPIPFNPPPPEE